jgi:hypothetical protein
VTESGTKARGGFAFVLTFAAAFVAMLAFSTNALAETGVQCAPTGMEAVSTDQESYPPGSTVYTSGGGFLAACDVELRVTRPDGVVESAVASTDLSGNVSHEYVLPPPPGVLGMYTLEAIGLGGVVLASHTFTDGPEIRSPDLVPGYVTTGGAKTYSVLVRNTGDTTHRCIRVTLPAGYASISVLSTGASQGSFASSISGQVITFTNSTGIAGTTTPSINGWARFEMQATPPNNGPNGDDWTFRAWSNTGCSMNQTSNENVRIVAGTQPTDRRYTAEFVSAGGAPLTTPVTTGANATFRLRMTKQTDGQSNKISYFSVGLPRCLTNVSISNAGENSNNGSDWATQLFGNVVRWRDLSSGELDDGHSVTLTFTANTNGCALASHPFPSSGWEDDAGSAANAPSKLFTTSASAAVTFVPSNVAPTVAANNATVTVDEGQTATNSGVWADANPGDTVTLTASVGTITKSGTNPAGTWSWSYPTTDGPAQMQVVTITANDGTTSSSTTFQLNVNNVAPSATFNAPASVDEGSSIALSLSSPSDPSSVDTASGFEYRFSCDDGATWTVWSSTNTASCATDDNGTRNVKGEIRDKDGGTSTYSASVTVNNLAPTATFNAPDSVNEGSNVNLSLIDVVDPGTADTHEYRFKCGDADWTAYGNSASHSCATTDNGTIVVKGQVRDDDGGESAEHSATVNVNNVAPTAAFNAPESVDEGSNINLSLTDPSDPSSADTAAGFEYRFSCDNGDTWTEWGASNTASCSTDDNGTQNVKGEIRDKDGGTSTYSASVTVNNVAPSATFNAPESVGEGSNINLSLTDVVDPGSADTHQFRFSCDGGETWTAWGSSTHACPTTDNGTVEVRGQVDDDDGASDVYSDSVTVNNVAPAATITNNGPVNEGSNINLSLTDVVDPGSADTHEYRFSCDGGSTWTDWSSTASHSCSTDDDGTMSVQGEVRDDDGGVSEAYSASVTVDNVAPSATFNAPESVNEGSNVSLSLTDPSDPSSVDTAAGFQYRFSCDGGGTWTPWSSSTTHACSTDDNGTKNVEGEIRDKDGGTRAYGASVTVDNVAPTATFDAPRSVNEGSGINLSLTTPSDPSSADTAAGFQYAFDCGDGSGYGAYSSSSTRSCPTSDNGTRSVGGKIKDKDGGANEYTATVTVDNVTPTLTSLTPSSYLVLKETPVSVTGAYTDPGTGDAFACTVNWDEPTGTPENVAGGPSSCSASHTYAAQGTYTVSMKVSDDDGGESNTLTVIITVYDPGAGGFVTGGGWINSPTGSYAADPTASGRANFGFNSQYKKGASVPTGQTEFQLHFAAFNFHSDAYEVLVVSGHKAQYRGTGRVNGLPGHKFVLTAYDGQITGGGGVDRFRIKITRISDNVVVYDTKMGTSDDMDLADPLAIGGGSIVIHKAK